MNTLILSIGDELILGQTVDTNSAWLSQQCAAIGLTPVAHVTVSDSQSAIEEAMRDAIGRCDVLLISGGLGPTDDDLTRHALAAVMGTPLELDPAALENVERFFRAIKRPMPERNRIQAMIPRGAEMIENTNGTAPGIQARIPLHPGYQDRPLGRVLAKSGKVTRDQVVEALQAIKLKGGRLGEYLVHGGYVTPSDLENALELQRGKHCEIFIMPGVPKEMKKMFERSILPAIQRLQQEQGSGGQIVLSRTLHTFGLGESAIAEKLGNLMDRTRNPSVGTTVSAGVVSLRLNAYFGSRETAERELAVTEELCRDALGDLIYGKDEETLPAVVARLLKEREKTIATAESCTGGLLAKYLTDIPGSSTYFERGWVTYSNDAKINSLGIAPEVIAEHGAVSEEVVEAMAIEAYLHSGADCSLSISGIAGPDGGTPEKPVGTVCIGLYFEGSDPPVTTRTFIFPGDREMVRDRSAKMAMTMLRLHLLGKPMPF